MLNVRTVFSSKLRTTIVVVLLIGTLGTALAGMDRTISQKNKAFSSSEITVKPGDQIVFANEDDVAHNVFCNDADCKFNTKLQSPGSKTPVTFEKEGTFEVRCAVHPKMKLTVTVKK